jgi:hypothetical protein
LAWQISYGPGRTVRHLRVHESPRGGVFRFTGWLDGKRIRKNFPTRSEASDERQALEIQRLQAETGIRTTVTRLTDVQLHEAEASFRGLA